MNYRSGFVNIIGFPNVGKSTLINSILDKKISIITKKVQTTRHRIFGILNKPKLQIIFSDTPGFLEKKKYILHKIMMQYIKKSFEDADIILLVTELGKYPDIPQIFYKKFKEIISKIPIIILINKIDKIGLEYRQNILYKTINHWSNIFPNIEILPISALKNINKDLLMDKIYKFLPKHMPFYPKNLLSDRNDNFFINEIIRKEIFNFYKQEIPYSVEIKTEFLEKKTNTTYIYSIIYVEKNSQKTILIGKNKKSIKILKYFSEKKISLFFCKKISLELIVKVSKNWRNNYKKLKNLGY
ncbi:GTPase Era [Blattabacterium cuenoti]|uniref:GTPase Era n=1 Tax=Blattabacterium cuenoti TaxID=1653831 RepID=UPI001EEB0C26|nr:GTPase Era [Blattabacterium cuenoti]